MLEGGLERSERTAGHRAWECGGGQGSCLGRGDEQVSGRREGDGVGWQAPPLLVLLDEGGRASDGARGD